MDPEPWAKEDLGAELRAKGRGRVGQRGALQEVHGNDPPALPLPRGVKPAGTLCSHARSQKRAGKDDPNLTLSLLFQRLSTSGKYNLGCIKYNLK